MTRISKLLCLTSLIAGTPLLGILLVGSPLTPYLAFPPATEAAEPSPFSWLIFGILSLLLIMVLVPFFFRFFDFSESKEMTPLAMTFPCWGWAGLGFLMFAWTMAWSRFPWFHPLQGHTFTPLWMGYIFVINALAVKRTGRCLMIDKPYFYLSLFPLSAGFWWIFEYLNRFVHNWYYLGDTNLDAATYFWAATIPFSTVLPAIVGTSDYLQSFARLRRPFQRWRKMPIPQGRSFGGASIIVACVGLMGIGIWPDLFYPLLWLSPLLILVGLQEMWGERSVFIDIRNGDWSPLVLSALAGLVCGFFWEMWNYYSLAHWVYIIPHVHAVKIFEMPLLGYAGYLPFGVTCLAFVQFLLGEFTPSQQSRPITNPIPR